MKYFFLSVACLGIAVGTVDARIRFGTTGAFVEVNDSNEHYLQYVRHIRVPGESQTGATWEAGNDTTGKTPAEVQQIVDAIRQFETNPTTGEIHTAMRLAPNEWFTFANVSHAKATVRQRLETIDMMKKFNAGRYKMQSPASTTASSSWRLGPKGREYYFRQHANTAFAAIAELCAPNAVTHGECAGAAIACIWWGASQGMGAAAFNALYPGQTALNMDPEVKYGGNNSHSRNMEPSVDTGIRVPGDWIYMVNHNYGQVINVDAFKRKGWLTRASDGLAGENAIYVGGGLYEGLVVPARTEADLRATLLEWYNTNLDRVIRELERTGGVSNGVEVKTINSGADAAQKIRFVALMRIKHDL